MSSIDITAKPPITDIRDNLIFAANGNVTACFRVSLPEIYSLSEADFETLHNGWFQAFKSLPAGTVVHRQDIYIKEGFSGEGLPKNTFLARATHDHFKGRGHMRQRSHLFLTLARNRALNSPKYVNPFRKVPKGTPGLLERRLEDFLSAVRDCVSLINSGRKITLAPLDRDEILDLGHEHFNGYNTDMDCAVELGRDGIRIGRHHFDMLCVNSERRFGETVATSKVDERFTSKDFSFHQGFLDGLGRSLREDHIVNQIIYMDDRHKWRELLEKKIGELKKSSNFGSQNKVVLKKVTDILERINTDDSSRTVRGHLNVLYWSERPEDLERTATKIKTELKQLDIVPYYPSREERKNFFLNSYPCFATNLGNTDLYVTDLKHSLCLFLNNTGYRSDPEGIVFCDRETNVPVVKDVWDTEKKRIKARNFAIFAPTGEGKSFLANNILRQYFEMDVRLVIIDLGGSYTKFAKLYPGQHAILRYRHGKDLGINPFYIKEGKTVSAGELEELATFLFELSASGPNVPKSRSVSLKRILRHYYDRHPGAKHSLRHFYGFVKGTRSHLLETLEIDPHFFDIDNFLHLLSEYVGDGLYGFLFEGDGDTSRSLADKRLIIFELDQVKDNREILSVMLKLIKTAVQRTIWRNKEERGIILFDEFAKQLKFPGVLESVEFYYQAIRKQEGAIGIILQSINQLPESSTAASILENTQVIYSLNNEKGYDAIARRLNLNSHDLAQLRSIRNDLTGERKYTEMFIKIGKQSNIFRLEVPPEVFAAYLTDGPANEAIMRIYEECGNMETAIKTFLGHRPLRSKSQGATVPLKNNVEPDTECHRKGWRYPKIQKS